MGPFRFFFCFGTALAGALWASPLAPVEARGLSLARAPMGGGVSSAWDNPALLARGGGATLSVTAVNLSLSVPDLGFASGENHLSGTLSFASGGRGPLSWGASVSSTRVGDLARPLYGENSAWGALAVFVSPKLALGFSVTAANWSAASGDFSQENPWSADGDLGVALGLGPAFIFSVSCKRILSLVGNRGDGATEGPEIHGGFCGQVGILALATGGRYLLALRQIDLSGALEVRLGKALRLSLGTLFMGPDRGIAPSAGFGFQIGALELDYGFLYPLNAPGFGTHGVTARWGFPK